MFDYIKMKATKAQRISIKGVKTDVKKGAIVEVRKSEVNFFTMYGFIEVKMEDLKPVMDKIKDAVTPKKKKK